MKEFKVGDKVYFPAESTRVLTVSAATSTVASEGVREYYKRYPLQLPDWEFTTDGKILYDGELPWLFHATPKNHALLEQLYGKEFEKPPAKTSSENIVQMMLERGSKFVPCWVSDNIQEPDPTDSWDFITEYSKAKSHPYVSVRFSWKYATPFDPNTGQPITELPE